MEKQIILHFFFESCTFILFPCAQSTTNKITHDVSFEEKKIARRTRPGRSGASVGIIATG